MKLGTRCCCTCTNSTLSECIRTFIVGSQVYRKRGEYATANIAVFIVSILLLVFSLGYRA